jgi:hypothetical protein
MANTDVQTALDAVLAKREALSFVESELLQERYLRVEGLTRATRS